MNCSIRDDNKWHDIMGKLTATLIKSTNIDELLLLIEEQYPLANTEDKQLVLRKLVTHCLANASRIPEHYMVCMPNVVLFFAQREKINSIHEITVVFSNILLCFMCTSMLTEFLLDFYDELTLLSMYQHTHFLIMNRM